MALRASRFVEEALLSGDDIHPTSFLRLNFNHDPVGKADDTVSGLRNGARIDADLVMAIRKGH